MQDSSHRFVISALVSLGTLGFLDVILYFVISDYGTTRLISGLAVCATFAAIVLVWKWFRGRGSPRGGQP